MLEDTSNAIIVVLLMEVRKYNIPSLKSSLENFNVDTVKMSSPTRPRSQVIWFVIIANVTISYHQNNNLNNYQVPWNQITNSENKEPLLVVYLISKQWLVCLHSKQLLIPICKKLRIFHLFWRRIDLLRLYIKKVLNMVLDRVFIIRSLI